MKLKESDKTRIQILVLAVVLLIIVRIIIEFGFSINTNNENSMISLLSTLSQVVGLVFAIILSLYFIHIELIVGSNQRKKPKSLPDLLKITTAAYIVFALWSILFPLLLLSVWGNGEVRILILGYFMNPHENGIKWALSFSIITLIGLPIFIMRFCYELIKKS